MLGECDMGAAAAAPLKTAMLNVQPNPSFSSAMSSSE